MLDKGKKGDLAPKKRKVTSSSAAQADDVKMIHRANSGDLKKVAMSSNQESKESGKKKTMTIAKFAKGGTVLDKEGLPAPTSNPDVKLPSTLVKGGTQAVANYQKKLGVHVDGAWGKDTQAAYEKYKASRKPKVESSPAAKVIAPASTSKSAVAAPIAKQEVPTVKSAIADSSFTKTSPKAAYDSIQPSAPTRVYQPEKRAAEILAENTSSQEGIMGYNKPIVTDRDIKKARVQAETESNTPASSGVGGLGKVGLDAAGGFAATKLMKSSNKYMKLAGAATALAPIAYDAIDTKMKGGDMSQVAGRAMVGTTAGVVGGKYITKDLVKGGASKAIGKMVTKGNTPKINIKGKPEPTAIDKNIKAWDKQAMGKPDEVPDIVTGKKMDKVTKADNDFRLKTSEKLEKNQAYTKQAEEAGKQRKMNVQAWAPAQAAEKTNVAKKVAKSAPTTKKVEATIKKNTVAPVSKVTPTKDADAAMAKAQQYKATNVSAKESRKMKVKELNATTSNTTQSLPREKQIGPLPEVPVSTSNRIMGALPEAEVTKKMRGLKETRNTTEALKNRPKLSGPIPDVPVSSSNRIAGLLPPAKKDVIAKRNRMSLDGARKNMEQKQKIVKAPTKNGYKRTIVGGIWSYTKSTAK